VRLSLSVSLLLVSFGLLAASGIACTPQGDPSVGPGGYTDDFEREELGDQWFNTGASWRIVDGRLNIRNARNRPLWLRRILPRDARIEFDIRSESADATSSARSTATAPRARRASPTRPRAT